MLDYGLTTRIENEQEIVLEKIFLAPKELVFEMFTKNEHLEHFWSPHNWEMFHCAMDFRAGGEWFYGITQKNPNPNLKDEESYGKIVYDEIDAPNQIAYHFYFTDKTGEINRELPGTKTEMEFIALDEDRTIVASRMEYESAEVLQELINGGLRESLAESWDRLSTYLAKIK